MGEMEQRWSGRNEGIEQGYSGSGGGEGAEESGRGGRAGAVLMLELCITIVITM